MADSIVQPHTSQTVSVLSGAIDDCWRRIGTGGDRSCPLLAEHFRCRNCPVYARAAVTVLDSLALGNAGDIAEPPTEHAPLADRRDGQSLLIFRIGDEWLALPAAALGEVTAPAPVHSLPHRRHAALLGVAAVRGTLLTCISLALLFGDAPQADGNPPAARFLILGQGRNAIALPVAEVAGVENVPRSALLPLPSTLARASARYTQAIFTHGPHSVGLLDAELLRHALSRSLT